MLHRGLRVAMIGAATMLTGGTASSASPATHPAITDSDVSLASIGLSLFVLEHVAAPEAITDPCPLLRPDQVGFFMSQQGFAPTQSGYSVSLFREDDATTGTTGVQCGVDLETSMAAPDPAAPHAVILDAFNPPEGMTIQDFATAFGASVLGPGAADVGGDLTGFCGAISGQPVCIVGWLRQPLVVEIGVGGPGVTLDATVAMLNAMLPSIVESLAAFEPSVSATTVVPTTLPGVSVPPTVAPTTAAAAKATLADFIAANPLGTAIVADLATNAYWPLPGV